MIGLGKMTAWGFCDVSDGCHRAILGFIDLSGNSLCFVYSEFIAKGSSQSSVIRGSYEGLRVW